MKNPVIVGTRNDLKSKKMFDLMKNIMNQNQSICLTTNIKNGTSQQSSGIILNQDDSMSLHALKHNIRKPWIIVGKKFKEYRVIRK